ncbi:MAG: coproporphyrinogen III oxidase [Bacteroidetes bacterium CG2_30_32_10]|nr:MAG: coproporphyrinogen III oxidase [Bacteroidetes bacterium CG2_30_32_10]
MNGIYIHIPFCRRACNYCNFHFSVSTRNKNDYIAAILKEIESQKNYFNKDNHQEKTIIDTVYFGGGTPSLLLAEEISQIVTVLNLYFEIKSNAEISLEANPEDLTKEKLREFKQIGINRLSIGVQSFFDEDLQFLNRPHNAQKAINSIIESKEVGFNNISIDLIYTIPSLTNGNWLRNLEIAFENKIPHISLYSLTVEPKTPLAHYIAKGKCKAIDELKSNEQYQIAMQAMEKNEYIHYEISNFCKKGYYSIHNSNYWKNQSYLGLGPSAHSYNGISRQWNIANTTEYIKKLLLGETAYTEEILTITQHYNEYILTTLRTIWGSDLDVIKNTFGTAYFNHCTKIATKYVQEGKIVINNNCIYLTNTGKLFADLISMEMFC